MRHFHVQAIALVIGLAALGGGCGGDTRACKKGTLLVEVTLAEVADALDITITTGSGQPVTKETALASGTTKGTIEVDFPSGYPTGQVVTVSIVASLSGVAVGSGTTTETLTSGCDHFAVAIAGGGDMNVSGSDMSGEDGGQCVPACNSCGAGLVTVCGVQLSCPCPVVAALQNPFTAAGDTITIEGSGFGPGASVTFPGGVTAAATVLSPQRLTAVVPATAGNGLLTVNQNASASNAVAFRRASFAIGVDPLRSYEQADYGHATPMITPRFGASAVVGDKYVWVIGGFDGTNGNNVVEQALINADGTIGGFVATAALTVGRYHEAAVRIGSWVYVLGGIASGASTNKIERAPIKSDGTLGTFVDAGTALSTARYNFATAVVGGWLYAFGGTNGVRCSSPTTLASVERAPIAADGTVGAFADAGITLPDARAVFTTLVAGHTLYALGGANVALSTIAADGTLGTFSAGGGASGADTVEYAFAAAGKLYEVGDFASTLTGSAPLTLDAPLGAFTATASAPGAGSPLVAYAVVGHYLYGFGGGFEPGCVGGLQYRENGSSARASLDAGSELVNFAPVTTGGLVTARSSFGAVVIGNHVYAIGGQTDFTKPDVEVATVDGAGVLGPFASVPGVSLVTQRSGFATAIVDNKLYVVSGVDKGGVTALTSVEVAPIGVDGTLGTFTAALAGSTPVTLANARAGLRLIVVGTIVGTSTPQLCALGGGTTLEVDCVGLNGDGTLAGSFAAVSGVTLVDPRGDSPGVLLSGSQVTVAYGSSAPYAMEQTTLNATTLAFSSTFASINTSVALRDDGVAGLMLGNHWLLTGGHYNAGGVGGNMFSAAVSYSTVDPATGAIALPAADPDSVLPSARTDHRLVAVENEIYAIGGTANGFPADFEHSQMR